MANKLVLSIPVKPFKITQIFGVNGDYYQAHGINIKGHNGLDLMAYHGQPVYASHDGTAYIEVDSNQGHGVVLLSDQPYDYNGIPTFFKTIYWHLCDGKKEPKFASPIQNGIKVRRGQLLGYADNTGLSTGDHTHFGLKPVSAGEQPFVWMNLEPSNGYGGAIDPTPYMETTLIQKLITLYQQLINQQ